MKLVRAAEALRPVAVHPFLLAAAFVLQLPLASHVTPAGFIRPLLVAELAVVTLVTLLTLAFRSLAAAALVTSLLGAVLVSRQPFTAILLAVRELFGEVGAYVLAGVLVATIVAGTVVLVQGASRVALRRHLPETTRYLNVFSVGILLLVILPALPTLPSWFAAPRAYAKELPAEPRPDVFVIMLDGYPRADELDRHFGFNNTEFLSALQERGFNVDPASRSNYPTTDLTLASMLAMDYIGSGEVVNLTKAELRQLLHESIVDGSGMRNIRAAGYEVAATAPGWEHVSLRAGVDRYIDRPEITDVERAVLWNSWLPDTLVVPDAYYADELHKRVVGILDDAVKLAAERRQTPVFALVHVPSPHLPLAFDAMGMPFPVPARRFDIGREALGHLSDAEFDAAFVANLRGLNQHVIGTVDDMLSAAATPPVIVIMSDHGYFETTPEAPDGTLRNLFAAYTPGSPGLLAGAPTPVNLLRYLTAPPGMTPVDPGIEDRYFRLELEAGNVTITEIDPTAPAQSAHGSRPPLSYPVRSCCADVELTVATARGEQWRRE